MSLHYHRRPNYMSHHYYDPKPTQVYHDVIILEFFCPEIHYDDKLGTFNNLGLVPLEDTNLAVSQQFKRKSQN